MLMAALLIQLPAVWTGARTRSARLRNSCASLSHASETPGDHRHKAARLAVGGRTLVGTEGALRYGYDGRKDKCWTGGR